MNQWLWKAIYLAWGRGGKWPP